jgi:hypothetical protein
VALLAEEIVEEWLNRSGYFTIRGAKLGVHEMDLLAVRMTTDGPECRHIEVQVSINPVSYITGLAKAVRRKTGRAAGSAKKRTPAELRAGVGEWIKKKYDLEPKDELRQKLVPTRAARWSRELVVHNVRHPEELRILEECGVQILRLSQIVADLRGPGIQIEGAAGQHLTALVGLSMEAAPERQVGRARRLG